LTLGSYGYSQSSDSSNSNRAELVSRCEAAANEVDISRKLIEAQKDAIAKAEVEKQLLIAKGDADDKQVALLTEEIGHLRDALVNEQKAFDESQAALDGYKKQLAKEVKKKRFYKTLAKFGTIAGIIVGAGTVLLIQR